MEIASFHPSGVENFEVAHIFFEDLCTPAVNYGLKD
jgi:hypothetical protein